jgi:creatinine amidohydrolase
MNTGILEEMNMDEVRKFKPEVVLWGIGSTEPHGPIITYGSDYFQCDGLCRRATVLANKKKARVLMYPTQPIGNNVNFKPFPFACRMRVRTLMLLILDVIEALEEDGIRKIVLVDGHGGNTDSIRAVLREHFDRTDPDRRAFVCMTRGMPTAAAVRAIKHPSDHGGEGETSRNMYLRPDLVRTDKLRNLPFGKPFVKSIAEGKVHFVRPWHLYVPMGGGGETREASPAKGKALVETGAKGLADFLVELSQAPWNPNFPYPADKK